MQVPLSTLTDRAKGRHSSPKDAYEKQQKLTPEEEATLLDWLRLKAQMGVSWTQTNSESELLKFQGRRLGKSDEKDMRRLCRAQPV